MKWHHAGIETECLDESAAFYSAMFGFHSVKRLQLLGESLIFMRIHDITIELVERTASHAGGGSPVHLAWEVDDLDREMEALEKKGLIPSEGPFAAENGWKVAFYEGPGAEVIELVETNK
ncbi:VOC family protein [Bacillus marinisedimentorum]|uniref:VOC family protein n=1 Tax=Bacillus marinisedimentorum TaxID=1821260 RepID=UPI0007E0FD96|nr:VOC family protein [Bacillus marinisedimentorum]